MHQVPRVSPAQSQTMRLVCRIYHLSIVYNWICNCRQRLPAQAFRSRSIQVQRQAPLKVALVLSFYYGFVSLNLI